MAPPGSVAAVSSDPWALWSWKGSEAKDGQRWNEIKGLGKCAKVAVFRFKSSTCSQDSSTACSVSHVVNKASHVLDS